MLLFQKIDFNRKYLKNLYKKTSISLDLVIKTGKPLKIDLLSIQNFTQFIPVLRIRMKTYADADPDPGSQKCSYGYGSKEVNTREKKLHNFF